MDRDLAVAIARLPHIQVEGVFERHVSESWRDRALIDGSRSGGRWAAPGTFPVIYLARPTEAVIVEAYRHLVDDVEGMTGQRVHNRHLIRAEVTATEILDLTTTEARLEAGLADDDLQSPVGEYLACQRIGHVAHQLNLHGVLAPSATGKGETLALFVDYLPPDEMPVQVGESVHWATLPPDPRRLRILERHDESTFG